MSLTAEGTQIVGSLAPATNAEAAAARGAARALPEGCALEIRLDAFVETPDLSGLRSLFEGQRLIGTLRSRAEGGAFTGTREETRGRLRAALQAGFDLVDVEFRQGENGDLLGLPPSRVILSSHDPEGLPADLPGVADRMERTGASFVKLVATPHDSGDALRLLQAQRGRVGRTTLFGMGEAGLSTRVLSSYLGAPLAYAALLPGRATGAGQPDAETLRRDYGVGRRRRISRILALFGGAVSHSLSPSLHNAFLESSGKDALYVPFALRSLQDELGRLADGLDGLGLPLAAASVTIPFKEEAARLGGADEGAANTLLFRGGTWAAANTDRTAMEELIPAAGGSDRGARPAALVLGAGGAARAAVGVLKEKGYEVLVWNRSAERGEALARQTGASFIASLPEESPVARLAVLVNTTPLGLREGDPLPCPPSLLGPGLLVLDAPYRQGGTELVKAAGRAGARVIDGHALLLVQAAGQARLFTGEPVHPRQMLDRLAPGLRSRFLPCEASLPAVPFEVRQ